MLGNMYTMATEWVLHGSKTFELFIQPYFVFTIIFRGTVSYRFCNSASIESWLKHYTCTRLYHKVPTTAIHFMVDTQHRITYYLTIFILGLYIAKKDLSGHCGHLHRVTLINLQPPIINTCDPLITPMTLKYHQ